MSLERHLFDLIAQEMEDKDDGATLRLSENRGFEEMMRETQNLTLDLDCISCLPEHIIHQILDCLPVQYAVRTSILSKKWKALCSSYPIVPVLRFDFNNFALKFLLADHDFDIDEIRGRFMDFVDSQLSNIKQRNLSVRKVALTVAVLDSSFFSRIDHWMELIFELREVEELCFFVQTKDTKWEDEFDLYDVCYHLPWSVLASEGLRSLSARGCVFADLVGSNLPVFFPFSSLKELRLSQAFFDEDTAIYMARCCPGIQVLEFEGCTFSMEVFMLSEFPNLKQASFTNRVGSLSLIDFQGTELEKFKCDIDDIACKFNAASCHGIRELRLIGCTIVHPHLLMDLTKTFPLLEEAEVSLMLEGAAMLNFKATSHNLRRLSFSVYNPVGMKKIFIDCPNLEWFKFLSYGSKEIYMNCPNLQKLCYAGDAIPVFPLYIPSPGAKDIYFQLGRLNCLDYQWFIHLRGLIEQFAQVGRTINLHLHCELKTVKFDSKEFGAIPASLLNNVHLEMLLDMEDCENPGDLVDALFWAVRPTTLAIIGCCYPFIEDMCDKLEKKSRGETCKEFCKKCWWHQLEGFKVEGLWGSKDIMENFAGFFELEMDPKRLSMKLYFKFNWCSHSSIPPTKGTEVMQRLAVRTEEVFLCHVWNGSHWVLQL